MPLKERCYAGPRQWPNRDDQLGLIKIVPFSRYRRLMLYDLMEWTLRMMLIGALLFAVWALGAGRIVRASRSVPQMITKYPVGFMPPPT